MVEIFMLACSTTSDLCTGSPDLRASVQYSQTRLTVVAQSPSRMLQGLVEVLNVGWLKLLVRVYSMRQRSLFK